MKTKANLIGLIAKKCFQLKDDKNIDAFFSYQSHVEVVSVEVFLNWDRDKNPVYETERCLAGYLSSRTNQIEILKTLLEDLDAIYHGLGVE